MIGTHETQRNLPVINGRQLCFFLAFLVPMPKLVEAPSILAYYAQGDLLLPAIAHFLLQGGILAAFVLLASRTDKTFYALIAEKTGEITARVVYIVYALFYVFFTLLPLFDLERLVYTVFFDSAPSLSAFLPFFILSAFICTKSLKAFGRCADIAAPLFLVSFAGLMVMSVGEADFSDILPFFGTPPASSANAFIRTLSYFSDTALLLPLLGVYRHRKGDGIKIAAAYTAGAIFVLFFLAVFYGIYSSIAVRQEYAFVKTSQYFKALSIVGRVDLLFIYLLTVVLLFYYCFPLQLAVDCFARAVGTKKKTAISAVLNFALLIFCFFLSRFYSELYALIGGKLAWIFPLFSCLFPLLSLLFLIPARKQKNGGSGSADRKPTEEKNGVRKSKNADKAEV